MVAAFRKSPSVKQWAAMVLFFGFLSWLLPAALDYYRDCKSIQRAVDVLASDCLSTRRLQTRRPVRHWVLTG